MDKKGYSDSRLTSLCSSKWHGVHLKCQIHLSPGLLLGHLPGHGGSHPAVGAVGAADVYLGALISVPPGMPASIVPSYGTAKCVTALSIVFAELGMSWLL